VAVGAAAEQSVAAPVVPVIQFLQDALHAGFHVADAIAEAPRQGTVSSELQGQDRNGCDLGDAQPIVMILRAVQRGVELTDLFEDLAARHYRRG